MSTLSDGPDDGSGSNPYVHSAGPAIIKLLPAQAIGNIVSKTNELISDHREWLANLPFRNQESRPSTGTSWPPSSLVTPPPSLRKRIAGPSPHPDPQIILPECNSLVASASNAGAASASAQFSVSLASASATASASIASLQAALNSANIALANVRSSATQALGSASQSIQLALQSASAQSQSAFAASSSATVAIASAQTSASQAIAGAQSSASASVLSANNALTSVQASASAAIASANAVASEARATATNAIAQAQATISAVASQASATIAASRISAMNTTKFVLVVTFSILGSSLLTILFFYLIIRYRRSRRIKKQDELKASIRRKRESDESSGPSLSDFPFPVNRTQWSRVQSSERGSRNRSLARERERERERERGRERTGYWPKGNEMASAADNMRASRPMDLPPPAARKTWAVGPAPRSLERASALQFVGNNNNNNSPDRQTWSSDKEDRDDTMQSQSATLVTTPGFPTGMSMPLSSRDGLRTGGMNSSEGRPNMVRKNTLTYDPEHPDRPPKFTTWLEDSFRSVSPLPTIGTVEAQRPEVQRAGPGRQSTLVEGRGLGAPPGNRGDSDSSGLRSVPGNGKSGGSSRIGTAI